MLLFGHSHIIALHKAAKQLGINAHKYYLAEQNHVIKFTIQDMIKFFPKKQVCNPPIVFALFGFDHIWSMSSNFTPFNFFISADQLQNIQIIPEKLMESYVLGFMNAFSFPDYMQEAIKLVESIYGKQQMYQLAAPPPILWEGARKSDMVVTKKVWDISNRLRENFCEQFGLIYIQNPPECIDHNGFLKSEFARDWLHGNTSYGCLVLESLKKQGIL